MSEIHRASIPRRVKRNRTHCKLRRAPLECGPGSGTTTKDIDADVCGKYTYAPWKHGDRGTHPTAITFRLRVVSARHYRTATLRLISSLVAGPPEPPNKRTKQCTGGPSARRCVPLFCKTIGPEPCFLKTPLDTLRSCPHLVSLLGEVVKPRRADSLLSRSLCRFHAIHFHRDASFSCRPRLANARNYFSP